MDVPQQLMATAGAEIKFSGLFKMGTRRAITMVAEYYSKSSDFPGCASAEPTNQVVLSLCPVPPGRAG
jgi:hypothetical protein